MNSDARDLQINWYFLETNVRMWFINSDINQGYISWEKVLERILQFDPGDLIWPWLGANTAKFYCWYDKLYTKE